MTAKCVGCGLDWNVSIYQKIPRTGYICPHCEKPAPRRRDPAKHSGQPEGSAAENEEQPHEKRSHSRTPPAALAFDYARPELDPAGE
ncbi:MAG: hypothetical protein ACLU38_04175 [Dysosmobacter sp.]